LPQIRCRRLVNVIPRSFLTFHAYIASLT